MSFQFFFKRVILLTLAITGLSVFAQSFTVENVTGNSFATLDSSTLVTYTVRLTGASATNVVPKLTPPACSFNGDGVSYFSTSYAGANGSSVPSPISSWTVNTTRTVSFYVHLYVDAGVCDAGLGSVCTSAQTMFDLSFTFDGATAPVSTPDDNDLLMGLPTDGERLDLSAPVYTYEFCFTFEQSGSDWDGVFDYNDLNFDASDPDQRVILAMEWFVNPDNGQVPPIFQTWSQWLLYVNPQENYVHMPISDDAGEIQFVTVPVFDAAGNEIPHAPYGGGGGIFECNPTEVDTNFFDISDARTNKSLSSPRVRDAIAADLNGSAPPNTTFVLQTNKTGVTLRSMTIYTATQTRCAAGPFAFGPPPSDFNFTEFNIAADGSSSATIDVPTSWGTTQLGSDYNMEWFLVSDTRFEPIPISNAKSLSVNFNMFDLVPAGSDPTDFQIEARVKQDPDGGSDSNASYASITSPVHTLDYNLSSTTYDNQEEGADADNFLDPGETANLTYSLFNGSAQGITNLSLVITNPDQNNTILYNDVLLDEPLTQNFGGMNPGQTNPIQMDLTLIQVDPTLVCDNLEIEILTSFTHEGVNHAYSDALVIPVNCGSTSADNYLLIDPPVPVTICNQDVVVVSNNSTFSYQYRFFESLTALVEDTPSETNGSGVWAEPNLPTDPDLLPVTYYVRLQAANNNETRRIATVSIEVTADDNCDPCGAFDVNNDDTVDETDFSLNAAQTWTTGGMLTLVTFINDSQLAGCFIP